MANDWRSKHFRHQHFAIQYRRHLYRFAKIFNHKNTCSQYPSLIFIRDLLETSGEHTCQNRRQTHFPNYNSQLKKQNLYAARHSASCEILRKEHLRSVVGDILRINHNTSIRTEDLDCLELSSNTNDRCSYASLTVPLRV